MFNWLFQGSPQPMAINFGIIKIHWYGLLMVVAIVVCLCLILFFKKSKKLESFHLWNLFFYLIIFGLIGARVYHVLFYNFTYFANYPLDIFKIWQGGLAIHGALIAGALTIYFYCRKNRLHFLRYLDVFAVVFPLGQAIGRWGNYFNQELFGKPCDHLWCLAIESYNRPVFYQSFAHFQPLFLYESILNLLLFIILLGGYQLKKWPAGMVTFTYLIGYSLIRFFMEFLRLDALQTFLGLKWVQWLCLMIIVGTIIFWKINRKKEALESLTL